MQEQLQSLEFTHRLSRDDERAGESVSIENQKEMLARYVREQGWTLYDYYCDDGVSGTTFDRPGLNRLVQDATDHKINLGHLTKDLSSASVEITSKRANIPTSFFRPSAAVSSPSTTGWTRSARTMRCWSF